MIARFGIGGAERMALLLVQELARAGDEVALVAAPGFLDSRLPSGVRRYAVPDRGRSVVGTARSILRLVRVIHDVRPDVVHAHGVRVLGMVLVARWLRGDRELPVLATHQASAPSDQVAAARILGRADHVACVSEALHARLVQAGVDPRRVSIAYNAVPAQAPLGPDDRRVVEDELALGDAPVVSLIGRLEEQKRPERFVSMAAEVALVDSRVRFLVIGDGSLRAATEAHAQRLGVADRVRFTGQRADPLPLIARSDVVVFTSTWEGLAVAALEALAAGVPIVASDSDGMRELLGTGAGVIVDDPSASTFAGEVVGLLRDPGRRERMSDAGRSLVASKFSPAQSVRTYRDLYDRLVEGGRSRRRGRYDEEDEQDHARGKHEAGSVSGRR